MNWLRSALATYTKNYAKLLAQNQTSLLHSLKVLIAGESQVGKTSLILNYTENKPADLQNPVTLDTLYKTKELQVGPVEVKVRIFFSFFLIITFFHIFSVHFFLCFFLNYFFFFN